MNVSMVVMLQKNEESDEEDLRKILVNMDAMKKSRIVLTSLQKSKISSKNKKNYINFCKSPVKNDNNQQS